MVWTLNRDTFTSAEGGDCVFCTEGEVRVDWDSSLTLREVFAPLVGAAPFTITGGGQYSEGIALNFRWSVLTEAGVGNVVEWGITASGAGKTAGVTEKRVGLAGVATTGVVAIVVVTAITTSFDGTTLRGDSSVAFSDGKAVGASLAIGDEIRGVLGVEDRWISPVPLFVGVVVAEDSMMLVSFKPTPFSGLSFKTSMIFSSCSTTAFTCVPFMQS
jgi:hypothetical protein